MVIHRRPNLIDLKPFPRSDFVFMTARYQQDDSLKKHRDILTRDQPR